MKDEDNLDLESENKTWQMDNNDDMHETELEIFLDSPLRLKKNGHYTRDITFKDIMHSAFHRARILSALYGDGTGQGLDIDFKGNGYLQEKKLYWQDLYRYSARQGEAMRLGGVMGEMRVKAALSSRELALLEFAELFHAGKNASFGLGKIRVERGS